MLLGHGVRPKIFVENQIHVKLLPKFSGSKDL